LPTVHLSLPNAVYAELKERAAEYGVQVTDLIKMYVRQGLELGLVGVGARRMEAGELEEVKRKLSEVEAQNRNLKAQVVLLRGKVRELQEFVEYLIQRIETLEEQVVGRNYDDIEIREE